MNSLFSYNRRKQVITFSRRVSKDVMHVRVRTINVNETAAAAVAGEEETSSQLLKNIAGSRNIKQGKNN